MYAQDHQANFTRGPLTMPAAASALAGETRQPEVPHQLDMLERNVAGVAEAVSLLESRLASSILRPEGPANTNGDKLRGAQSTPVSTRLQEANDALVALRCRIESMHQRLEA